MPSRFCIHYVSKSGRPSSGHRTGKGLSSSQFPKRVVPKNMLTIGQMHSSPMLVRSCLKSCISVLYCARLCMKFSFGISDFLEEIPSVSHSVAFLYFFALITEECFLISSCYSLELCIQMFLSFLFSFVSHFSSFHSCL